VTATDDHKSINCCKAPVYTFTQADLLLQVPFVQRLAPSMLAGLVALSTGLSTFDAVYAPAARADEEEVGTAEPNVA
jgi:hypothetical protein